MSDTLQAVSWHLAFACPFRQGAAVDDWLQAHRATSDLRAIDDGGDVYGDICVLGTEWSGNAGKPYSGFRISKVVAPVGDLAAARRTCSACPANALEPSKLAGCCGMMTVYPNDKEVEAALRATIAKNRLEARLHDAFPVVTSPLWYGLWVSREPTRAQLELFLPLLQEIREEGVAEFRQACERALRHGLSLRTMFGAPGHVDMGFHTTFPHCPRCKCGSGARWGTYSTKPTRCAACGQEYIPAETAKSERSDEPFDRDLDKLESLLTPAEFAALNEAWRRRHAGRQSPIERVKAEFQQEVAAALKERARTRGVWRWWRDAIGRWFGRGGRGR